MTNSLGAAMTDPLVALSVVGIAVDLVIGIVIASLLYVLLRRTQQGPVRVVDCAAEAAAVPAGTVTPVAEPIPNRQAMIAAVSAAIAEELGTDISAIRILSVKKL